jgi:hypothetical protein
MTQGLVDGNTSAGKFRGNVKSLKTSVYVIPADPGSESGTGAGIQEYQGVLDPGFRRGDGLEHLL